MHFRPFVPTIKLPIDQWRNCPDLFLSFSLVNFLNIKIEKKLRKKVQNYKFDKLNWKTF